MRLNKAHGLVIILSIIVAIFLTHTNTTSSSIIDNFRETESKDVYYEEIYSFYYFNLIEDAPEMISSKSNPEMNFSYSGGSSNLYATEVYHYELVEAATSDFIIEVTMEYSYTGTTLAEFFVRLESDYSEDGSIADDVWEHRITQNILFDVSDVEGPDCKIIGHPSDGYEEYNTTDGTVFTSGYLVFRIGRQNGQVLCEIDSQPDYYLSHFWSSGLTKPLNSVYIGGTIFPINDSAVNVSFTDFFGYYKHGEESESPSPTPSTTPSNANETMPYWFWIIIGGAFSIAIAIPIVLNLTMKKRIQ